MVIFLPVSIFSKFCLKGERSICWVIKKFAVITCEACIDDICINFSTDMSLYEILSTWPVKLS